MPSSAKKEVPKESTDGKYFTVGHNFDRGIVLMGIPADAGVLIPADKFTFSVTKDRFDKLVRQHGLTVFKGKNKYECGECGLLFVDDSLRDKHGIRRHGAKPRYVIKDLDECSEEEKEQILAELGPRTGINRKTDPGYYTNPGDFHVPDPTASEEGHVDRELTNSIEWENTAASRK